MKNFKRLPETKNHTLNAWNAADELLVKHGQSLLSHDKNAAVFNDRFGYITCHFADYQPTILIHLKSQKDSIQQNLTANHLPSKIQFVDFFDVPPEENWDIVLLHIPKSLDLWEWFLKIIHAHSKENTVVLCGFLTRHFTPAWLSSAQKYFSSVSQSKADKKARIMTLEGRIDVEDNVIEPIEIPFNQVLYKHYPGIFSFGKTDPATRFLLENIKIRPGEKKILDWGCGSGIIASQLHHRYGSLTIMGMDDYLPAVQSAKSNVPEAQIYWDYQLEALKNMTFDLIITNPPFHFEYENDISISLQMFEKAYQYLEKNGRLVVVANVHLNYKTHLEKKYGRTDIINQNGKFVIYECFKFPHAE